MTRPLPITTALASATILAGLIIRFAPLGFPAFVTKYGGSALYALLIYWVVSGVIRRTGLAATLAGCIATAIEFFKLYESPAVDAFRQTLPGILILGRFFSYPAILAYWLAIAAGIALDRKLLGRR